MRQPVRGVPVGFETAMAVPKVQVLSIIVLFLFFPGQYLTSSFWNS